MRLPALVLVVALLAGCKGGDPVSYRVVAETGRAGAGIAAAGDAGAFRQLWATTAKGGSPPQLDFAHEYALFISAGVKPTGGYRLDVSAVRQEGDIVVVRTHLSGPEPGDMVTQALTYPGVVVAVERPQSTTGGLHVKALDDAGRVWAETDATLAAPG